MFKFITLIAATLSLAACVVVPYGHGRGDDGRGDRGSHEHHDDRDGDRRERDRH